MHIKIIKKDNEFDEVKDEWINFEKKVSNQNITLLNINIAKWYNDVDSPVIFMVDDFCNKWIDLNGNGEVDLGEDWGYAKDSSNSSFNFLRTTFLKKYPYLKITFFTTVGKRSPVIKHPLCKVYSSPINEDKESKIFFRSIHHNKQFEIAYHGLTHGIPGKTAQDFYQEWKTFCSVSEAVKETEKGRKIYFDTFGEYPKGGKYCGYEYNDFSDDSINQTGFLWWCRIWNRGQKHIKDAVNFKPKYFGKNKVIDIPSTIIGSLCTIYKNEGIIKYFLKITLKFLYVKKKLKSITKLLKNKQIISIQEHIAPSRVDKKRQTPNIFDDKESLFIIFDFLKNKNVWYATGTEVAEYFDARENIKIVIVNENKFLIKYKGRPLNPILTIIIKTNKIMKNKIIKVIAPDGKVFKSYSYYNGSYKVNLRIINGMYHIR